MALALRRDRAQRSGRGAASADLTLDLVRKIQKWKSKAVRTLEKKREARAMSVMKRNAERMVELEDFLAQRDPGGAHGLEPAGAQGGAGLPRPGPDWDARPAD
ncbi:hypothetical protein FNF31_07136 [Cafeteria roenbergensis]|uniref:Uncharacterized protein n=1 Tax=Cafeteria roenbergensis TaxID=33653 RepID=A0A5A8CBC5_CAFRO|nr:hypothetical protein FNF31_07136 [Cafeteria roenbergensis]